MVELYLYAPYVFMPWCLIKQAQGIISPFVILGKYYNLSDINRAIKRM
jgi:hypothetical protein